MTAVAASTTEVLSGRRHHAVFHPLRVASVEPLTEDSVAVTFEVPDELREEYRFVQGQHVSLRSVAAGDDVRRSYSICAPATSGVLRVAVKRLETGVFSSYVHSTLRPGEYVDVMTPTGRFYVPLDPAAARHYCAFAAGSGITPVFSILTTTLEVEPQSRFTLVYGNRTTSSIMFLEELEDVKNRYPDRFNLVHVLSREPQEVELFSGRIDGPRVRRLLDTLIPPDTVDEWFLCGPYAMTQEVRQALLDAGVDRRHVHLELFHVETEPPRRQVRTAAVGSGSASVERSTVAITLDGRSTSFELERDGPSILDGALKVRSDAPYACKGGVCGTCRAKLLEGDVEMDRNFALEQDEMDSGFVLACQSHPRSPRVALDFDA